MAEEQNAKSKPEAEGSKPEDLQKLIAAEVAKVEAKLEEKYKSEIAGLNRKNTELEKTIKDKEETKRTLEDRVRAIEEAASQKDRELAKERLIRALHAEAEKRGLKLDEEIPVDKLAIASVEEGVALLDKRVALYKERDKKTANETLLQGAHKPQSGSGEPGKTEPFAGLSLPEIEQKIRDGLAKT